MMSFSKDGENLILAEVHLPQYMRFTLDSCFLLTFEYESAGTSCRGWEFSLLSGPFGVAGRVSLSSLAAPETIAQTSAGR